MGRPIHSEVIYNFKRGSRVQWVMGKGERTRLVRGIVRMCIMAGTRPGKYLERFPRHWFKNVIERIRNTFDVKSYLVEVRVDEVYPWWEDGIGHVALYWPDVNKLMPYNPDDWKDKDAPARLLKQNEEKKPVASTLGRSLHYKKVHERWRRKK